MNHVGLIGRVTQEVQLNEAGDNKVLNNTLAVPKKFSKDENDNAYFINFVVWGKRAETLAKYVKKGHRLAIEGELQTRSYENNEGNTVYVTEVNVSDFTFLEPKKDD